MSNLTIDDLEHKMSIEAIGFAFQMMEQHKKRYEDLIKAKNDMENHGLLIDPTLYLWMEKSQNVKLQILMAQAAIDFINAIEKVKLQLEPITKEL